MRRSWVVLLSVLVLLGWPGTLTSAHALDPAPPVNQTGPSVSGTARVFSTLSADPGTWSPVATSYAFTWLRDGTPIPGASASTYRVTEAERAHRLAVRVVATGADGGVSAPATSAPTPAVQPAAFSFRRAPTISGVRRWDHRLTVRATGTWSPAPTSTSYRWLRDGVAIKGAVHASYTARVADFGHHLQVRVVAHRPSFADAGALSGRTAPIGHRVRVKKRFTYSIATRGRVTADLATFARIAAQIYADPRGWRSAGYAFRQVAHGGDFTLVLSNAAQLPSFGYPCDTTWSCRVGRYVVINQTRWLHASPAWNAAHQPLRDYRSMVVDHETGHWLGHHHLTCPGKGRLAPLMMQQSKGLHGCRFNPFPLPSERWTTR